MISRTLYHLWLQLQHGGQGSSWSRTWRFCINKHSYTVILFYLYTDTFVLFMLMTVCHDCYVCHVMSNLSYHVMSVISVMLKRIYDSYFCSLLHQKDVVTDWQTDRQTDICSSWAAFAAEKSILNLLIKFFVPDYLQSSIINHRMKSCVARSDNNPK